MKQLNWHQRSLTDRVRWLRYVLPPLLVIIVIAYQLGIAQAVQNNYGHFVHYSVEITFYSLAGPVVTWLTLVWVERKLIQQERLERQVQTAEREKVAVLAEERARIARDLHDGVAQTLYFLALKMDVLRQQLAGNETAVNDLRQMGQTTRQIIREVRRTIFALRPLDWSETGFTPGLAAFVRGFAEQAGWQAEVQIDETIAVPARLEPVIFRLVQESLNNVAKHAEATEVNVTLSVPEPTLLQLVVQDNGRGYTPDTGNHSGLGIKQMKARVETVNGTFQVKSYPHSGTCVTVAIPVNGVKDE